jgi:hypothetical protein
MELDKGMKVKFRLLRRNSRGVKGTVTKNHAMKTYRPLCLLYLWGKRDHKVPNGQKAESATVPFWRWLKEKYLYSCRFIQLIYTITLLTYYSSCY